MKNKNVTIAISDEAHSIVKEDASIFGGNVSAYLTYLILKAREEKQPKLPAGVSEAAKKRAHKALEYVPPQIPKEAKKRSKNSKTANGLF